jgi:1-phosphatidylinositol-4-phosphate 5-kinase
MLPIDVVLNGFAIVSTIVATLRAGSRLLYISEHQSIGIMDGPLILPSPVTSSSNITTATTNPLLELSENFKHCVRLSTVPGLYDTVRYDTPRILSSKEPKRRNAAFEERPYTLGAVAYKPKTFQRSVVASSSDLPSTLLLENVDEISIEELQQLLEEELLMASSTTRKAKAKTRPWWRGGLSRAFQRPSNEQDEPSTTLSSAQDYEKAITADFFYNVSIPTSGDFTGDDSSSVQRKHRLAELTVYCPKAFASLRSIFGISEESYLRSILASGPFVSFQSNSKGAARMGGVFFFTRDGAYMIKTIKQVEAKTLLRILPQYHRHMRRFGRSSLLTRFCGMYNVVMEQEDEMDDRNVDESSLAPCGRDYTFVVMNAVFPAEASRFIAERFDLKGSTVGREVSEEELKSKGSNAVLKDLDLAREVNLERAKGGKAYGLSIGATAKAALLSQLREDVTLLKDCNVMDYSLLVGIVHVDDQELRRALSTLEEQDRLFERIEGGNRKKKLDSAALYRLTLPIRLLASPPVYVAKKVWSLGRRTIDTIFTTPLPYYGSGACVVDGGKLSVFHGQRKGDRAIYYMGLIDFLQPWTKKKVLERFLKGLIGYDTNAVSVVTPEEYAARFLSYLDDNIT